MSHIYPTIDQGPLNVIVHKDYGVPSNAGVFLFGRLLRTNLYIKYGYESLSKLEPFMGRKRVSLYFTLDPGWHAHDSIMTTYPDSVRAHKLLEFQDRLERVPYLTPVVAAEATVEALTQAYANYLEDNPSITVTNIIISKAFGDVIYAAGNESMVDTLVTFAKIMYNDFFIPTAVLVTKSKVTEKLIRAHLTAKIKPAHVAYTQLSVISTSDDDTGRDKFSVNWSSTVTPGRRHFDYVLSPISEFQKYFQKKILLPEKVDQFERVDSPLEVIRSILKAVHF